MLQAELECFQYILIWSKQEGIDPKEFGVYHSRLDKIRYKYGFKKSYVYGPL